MLEPDYIFCAMGTNDYSPDAAAAFPRQYLGWLAAVRTGCPCARIFCIVPFLGRHARDIADAVEARRQGGDSKVHWIDAAQQGWFSDKGPTRFAYDGVHPSLYGNALLGALIVAEVEKVLRGGDRSSATDR